MIKRIAVTGTKGKSTTLRLLEKVFIDLHRNVYGTYGIDGYHYNQNMVRDGSDCSGYLEWDNRTMPVDVHLSEATSYTLKRGFYDNYDIDIGIWTSFDPSEHTEIHPSLGDYINSKKKLFNSLKPTSKMVVCRDMEDYSTIIESNESRVVSYGCHPEADYVISIEELSTRGMKFSITQEKEVVVFNTKLLGEFNAKNVAAAFIALTEMGINKDTAQSSLESFTGFKGRVERFYIPESKNHIVIDYAHTKDSLDSLLKLCSKIYPNQPIVTIFGCGGDKSRKKRPQMGKIAEKYSDRVVLTNDNPRSENPADIIADISSGFSQDNYSVVMDREEAIKTTLSRARASVIVLAGKGHEMAIEFKDGSIYHNDYNSLMEWCVQNNLRLVSFTHSNSKNGDTT